MTLGQLRTFVALADTGSGRAAAHRLVVSQPAVSAAVAALQREVGVPLVVREGRGFEFPFWLPAASFVKRVPKAGST